MDNTHPGAALLPIAKGLPESPGVYQFYNKKGVIIYVGKAKNLRKRVTSYFAKDHQYGKLLYLVHQVVEIKTIIVDTELDALLLENNLIKKYQPRYNVALKDDRSYPWICIKKERFPRIFVTRRLVRDGSQYFGPYTNGKMMYTILEFIKQVYLPRTCNLSLTEENINKKKFKVCLEFHIGNCLGPCEAKQSESDYAQKMQEIREILKGNIQSVIQHLEQKKVDFSRKQEYELAQLTKEKIESLENYKSKSVIVSPQITNVDVFSFAENTESAFVNYLKIVNGSVIQTHTLELQRKLEETKEELLGIAVVELRQRFESSAKEILVPFLPDIPLEGAEFIIPLIGDKKKLVELSERNARYVMHDKAMQLNKTPVFSRTDTMLERMKNDLRLSVRPIHMECFDNSNIQGDHAVSAMVVFRDLKPSKKDYRHYTIRSVVGPDDFASMEEVLTRRYERLLKENQPLPELIVVDGGKGQLSTAVACLDKLGLRGKVSIIGIAKKLEEIYFPEDSVPMYLDKKSPTLKIIQQMRDEAHRFGITHHRNKRSKATIKTELTSIDGIGEKTAAKLLTHFKSVKGIKVATQEELERVAGAAVAKKLKQFFSNEQDPS